MVLRNIYSDVNLTKLADASNAAKYANANKYKYARSMNILKTVVNVYGACQEKVDADGVYQENVEQQLTSNEPILDVDDRNLCNTRVQFLLSITEAIEHGLELGIYMDVDKTVTGYEDWRTNGKYIRSQVSGKYELVAPNKRFNKPEAGNAKLKGTANPVGPLLVISDAHFDKKEIIVDLSVDTEITYYNEYTKLMTFNTLEGFDTDAIFAKVFDESFKATKIENKFDADLTNGTPVYRKAPFTGIVNNERTTAKAIFKLANGIYFPAYNPTSADGWGACAKGRYLLFGGSDPDPLTLTSKNYGIYRDRNTPVGSNADVQRIVAWLRKPTDGGRMVPLVANKNDPLYNYTVSNIDGSPIRITSDVSSYCVVRDVYDVPESRHLMYVGYDTVGINESIKCAELDFKDGELSSVRGNIFSRRYLIDNSKANGVLIADITAKPTSVSADSTPIKFNMPELCYHTIYDNKVCEDFSFAVGWLATNDTAYIFFQKSCSLYKYDIPTKKFCANPIIVLPELNNLKRLDDNDYNPLDGIAYCGNDIFNVRLREDDEKNVWYTLSLGDLAPRVEYRGNDKSYAPTVTGTNEAFRSDKMGIQSWNAHETDLKKRMTFAASDYDRMGLETEIPCAQLTLVSEGANVALRGGGIHKLGSRVTIDAPLISGTTKADKRIFNCWMKGLLLKSTASAFDIVMSHNIKLTAVYDTPSYSVIVDVSQSQGGLGTAEGILETLDSGICSVNLKATENGSKFVGWYYNGIRMSDKLTFTMEATNVYIINMKVTAKFREANTTLIRFIRDERISVRAEYVPSGTTSIIAPTGYKSGYVFSYWVKRGVTPPIPINAGDTIIITAGVEETYDAVFVAAPVPCKITAIGCTATKPVYNVFDRATVIAIDAGKFKYFTLNGTVVSYAPEYTFTIDGDVTIEAHYEDIEQKPSVYLSKNTKIGKREEGNYVLSPIVTVVKGNSEIVEKGILVIGKDAPENDIDLNLLTPNVRKITSSNTFGGQLTGTYLNISLHVYWYARGYMIYKRGTDIFVEYSEVEHYVFTPTSQL